MEGGLRGAGKARRYIIFAVRCVERQLKYACQEISLNVLARATSKGLNKDKEGYFERANASCSTP